MVERTALIVDDNEGIILQLKTILTKEGFDVISFGNGLEAFNYIESNEDKLDLVILDMEIPGMHGIELLKKLKVKRLELPVICVSGSWVYEKGLKEKAEKLGADALLPKPIIKTSLIKVINRIYPK